MTQRDLDEHCKMVSIFTDRNDHTMARRYLAFETGDWHLVKVFDAIMDIHNYLGFMPHGLIETREYLTNEKLKPALRLKVTPEEFEALWNCL